MALDLWGGPKGNGAFSSIRETQSQRSAERFSILDWVWNQKRAVSAQNSRWGRGSGGGSGVVTDVTFNFSKDSLTIKRDSTTVGKTENSFGRAQVYLNNLVAVGNSKRSINLDIGAEGFYGSTTKFLPDETYNQTKSDFNQLGGGLIIRPFGRSSQDTSLVLKGGYINATETGYWTNSTLPQSLYGTYLGAEARLYLLPFLGGKAEYFSVLENEVKSLSGKWKMQKFSYGGFLEIGLIEIGVQIVSSEFIFTSDDTSVSIVKDLHTGIQFSTIMFF